MSLVEHYKTLHLLRYKFKYSTESVESMIPWELDVEMSMITNSINQEIELAKRT